MPDGSVDFILTDIPYEFDLHGGGQGEYFATRKQMASYKDNSLLFISEGIDYDRVFTEFMRICRGINICCFCSNKQVGKIMTWWEQKGYVATLLVWDKPNPLPLGNHCYLNNLEFIVYVRSRGVTYNNIGYQYQFKTFRDSPPPSDKRLHETEKPLFIIETFATHPQQRERHHLRPLRRKLHHSPRLPPRKAQVHRLRDIRQILHPCR